jgi:hypothetical protein
LIAGSAKWQLDRALVKAEGNDKIGRSIGDVVVEVA